MSVGLQCCVLLAVTALVTVVSASENITIKCPDYRRDDACVHVKVAQDRRLEMVCTVSEAYTVFWIQWLHHNGSDINDLDSDRMSYTTPTNHSATLVIYPVLVEDTGNYTCVTSQDELESSVELTSFIIPDYFLEGIIILSINLALCVLFIVCLTRSILKQRKIQKKINKMDKTEFEKMNIDT